MSTINIEWPMPVATNMVVHVRDEEPTKVNGLSWTAPKRSYVLRILLLDEYGDLLWTKWLQKGFAAGTVIQMPTTPTSIGGSDV